MKRSDRHKPENQNNKPNVNNETEQKNTKTDEGKISKYVNKDQIDKGKKFFSGKLSAYNTQIKEENKILKEKFTNLRSGNARQERDPDQKRPIIPIIVTGILLLPITILLAFLLITNFLPDETDMTRIASNDAADDTEETDATEETEDGTTEDDTEVAVVDDTDEEAADDLDASQDIPTQEQEILSIADYSSTERQQLQRAAQAAVNEKNAEIALIREQQAAERARQQAAEEERRQSEQAQTEDTDETDTATDTETDEEETTADESESPLAGNQVHTVTGEDNLYRIAIQYYGDGSAANVQRIRDANGISGDGLTVGQDLIIP